MFTNQGEQGHGRYVYTVKDANHLDFRIETSRDGNAWSCLMEGSFTRIRA